MIRRLTEAQAASWVAADLELMTILRIVSQWQLPDCWLTAGVLRNFLWDQLAEATVLHSANDVDVAFFDPNLDYETSEALGRQLAAMWPNYNWEIKNQAHMHTHNFPDESPYRYTLDAVSKYPETCTALACRLNEAGYPELRALWGLEDLAAFEVRPTPHFSRSPRRLAVYNQRVAGKNWQESWPQLTIHS